MNISEPIFFIGEGEYNINVFKEINATESFLSMDQDVRNCQNKESFDNCTTRQYIESILKECKCLPLNMRLSNQVHMIVSKTIFIGKEFFMFRRNLYVHQRISNV